MLGALIAATPAVGADRSWADEVSVVNQEMVIDVTGSKTNIIDVEPDALGYSIYDATGSLTTGLGCGSQSAQQVECGGLVLRITVNGSEGDDLIGLWDVMVPVTAHGGPGDDLLESGAGADTLEGDDGVDTLVGGDGADRVTGSAGDDLLTGGDGADTLDGGIGDDILESGGGSRNVLLGGAGRDLLLGGTGNDTLAGGGGDDALVTGTGKDVVTPGTGSDDIFLATGRNDTVRCGSDDRVRGSGGRQTSGCGSLPGSARVPVVWPPEPASARAAVLAPDSRTRAWPRRQGQATRVTVWVDPQAKRARRTRICLWTYSTGGRLLRRFPKRIGTKFPHTIKQPKPNRASYFARARHRAHDCRRRGF